MVRVRVRVRVGVRVRVRVGVRVRVMVRVRVRVRPLVRKRATLEIPTVRKRSIVEYRYTTAHLSQLDENFN